MNFIIEKNIPIPRRNVRTRGDVLQEDYPLDMMDVGDSFFCAFDVAPLHALKAYWHARNYGDAYDKDFVGRTLLTGVRIWRTR